MDITPQFLPIFHRHLFGEPPTDAQFRLYKALPGARGFDSSELNDEQFRAIVALSMVTASKHQRVLLLAPLPHAGWVVEHFNAAADSIFTQCKQLAVIPGGKAQIARGYSDLLKKIFIFGRLLQLETEPAAWTSFGFAAGDPVPEWLRPKLLSV